MPNGGTGTKRSEINLEKHLAKKGSVFRIQNKDDMCLARALVVSIAKIENDSRYKTISDHRRSIQTRLAHDLHKKANLSIGPCGLEEVKQFQTYLSDYQINIVSKDHQNSLIYSGSEKEKKIICFFMITIMTSSQACRPFLPENGIVTPVKKGMITSRIIYVLTRVNYVLFKIVLLFHGFLALIAIVFLKVRNVSIDTNKT